MSLNQSIARLKALDSHHPDWGNLLLSDDVDPQMVADIVAVVRDAIAGDDRKLAFEAIDRVTEYLDARPSLFDAFRKEGQS